MSHFSATPLLAALLGGFWLSAALIVRSRGHIGGIELATVALWLCSLAVLGIAIAQLSVGGFFRKEGFFAVLPGFWVPMIPFAISGALLLGVPAFRRALWAIGAHLPARAMVLIHGLRIAAIGGVAKGFAGVLPASFALPVGIPDLLFGASALLVGVLWPKGGLSRRTLIVWNIIGIAVIVPSAPLLMQMGLPGPLYTFARAPDARVLFEFPLVLAPTLIVPLFIFTNAVHAAVLWNGMRGERPSTQTPSASTRSSI
ncbi:hypothetical protein EUU22_15485 [Ciceribacter ferrooxidans]|uniref:Uncharacterized protein n=2 Tax=Ciceribacter ferrooxidans TaxID=2509717 RepID=A0A4Q2SY95_9HYPH|nr:hypothetical protein EUU22_15485 [Ciceribacter ferrooxidans]